MAQPHELTANPVVLREKFGNRASASDADTAHAPGLNSVKSDSMACYVLRDEALIEDFENGALVLLCEQLRLVQINLIARDVVSRLDGKRTPGTPLCCSAEEGWSCALDFLHQKSIGPKLS